MFFHLLFIACLFHAIHLTSAQLAYICGVTTNYTSPSPYSRNLNLTLSFLSANASKTGYFTTATGNDGSEEVSYGLVQCRGYASSEACKACANTLSAQITNFCPNQTEASIFNENCTLQYADWNFFSTVDATPYVTMVSTENVSYQDAFNVQLQGLLKNLSSEAASDSAKLAVGRDRYKSLEYVYAMVQCVLDVSVSDCRNCLQVISSYVPRFMADRDGGRLFALSCNLRYETSSFFQLPISPPPASASTLPPPLIQPNSTSVGTNSTDGYGKKSKSRSVTMVVIPVLASLAVLALACSTAYYFLHVRASAISPGGSTEDGDARAESLMISLNVLKVATQGFSSESKLGEGSFGPVYKGKLPSGQEIAVKRLSTGSRLGLEELKTEVMLIAKLLHTNLVRLLGFCLEEDEKILVYEYLPNGSLDKILYDTGRNFDLDWRARYGIIIGIARGLVYLHDDSELKIIHRDLKASSILLDESMSPKISNFGLAKLFHQSESQDDTNGSAGTYGYMAPEYARHDHFSVKSDVYSFGILILEIVTGRKNNSRIRNSINLQSHVWDQWSNGMAVELRDPAMGDQFANMEVLKCIHIGLLCVQESVVNRPTMSEVVMMLSSHTVTYSTPLRPAFFINREEGSSQADDDDDDYKRYSTGNELVLFNSEPLQLSINDVSITDLYPR